MFNIKDLNQFPGSQHLGLTFLKVDKEEVRAEMTADERHLRPGGIVNGGMYLILIETLGSIAACCHVDLSKVNPLGIQVTANHLRSAAAGEKMVAYTKPVHIGRTTHIWEVIVENQQGKTLS